MGEGDGARAMVVPTDTTHVTSLDGVRFLAFFGVFVFHAFQNTRSAERIVGYGALGVQVFFVLSGFLIGGLLLDARLARQHSVQGRLGTFYARRSLRIFPIYYLTLAVLLLVELVGVTIVGGR